MKCTHVCAAQTTYLFFTKLSIEPDFPCLADEIVEPRPDMKFKVAAFTVSEKSINTSLCKISRWLRKQQTMMAPGPEIIKLF